MSTKDRKELRDFMKKNPGLPARMREYFTVLDRDLRANDIWSTTTTTTTSTTTSTSTSTSTTSSTTSTSSSTTTTTA